MVGKKTVNDSKGKLNKIWVGKGSQPYNSSMKFFLPNKDIEMYSMHNEGKHVIAERIIRTLKNKTYKYMTSVSKNLYTDILDDVVNKYNYTYHSTIIKKHVDVKSNTYFDSSKEINNKDPEFKIAA